MKKFLFAVAVAAFCVPSAASAAKYGTAGCGLGSIVFGDDPGFVQVFASTTNGTFASQTFGITTGTSNCVDGGGMAAADKKAFVKMNYASLMRDAAAGQGEYLATFATMLGCQDQAQSTFFSATQKNYDVIFNDKADAERTLESVEVLLDTDPVLKSQCSAAGA